MFVHTARETMHIISIVRYNVGYNIITNIPLNKPNTAAYIISSSNDESNGPIAVPTPQIMRELLNMYRRLTHFRSEIYPKTTRPMVLVIPIVETSHAP